MESNYKNRNYDGLISQKSETEEANQREIKENNLEKSSKDEELEAWKVVAGIVLMYALGAGGCLLGNYYLR